MDVTENYIINEKTKAIIPEHVENNYTFSKVVEDRNVFIVKKKPLDMIKSSFKAYGSGYEGAVKASQSILRKTKMLPIRISGAKDMYWFSLMAASNRDCIWLALEHTERPIDLSREETVFLLTDGCRLNVHMSYQRAKNRMDTAIKFKAILQRTMSIESLSTSKPLKGYMIIKDSSGNYRIKK